MEQGPKGSNDKPKQKKKKILDDVPELKSIDENTLKDAEVDHMKASPLPKQKELRKICLEAASEGENSSDELNKANDMTLLDLRKV